MAYHPRDEIFLQVVTLYGEEFRVHSMAIAQSLIQARRSFSVEERRALMVPVLKRLHGIKGTMSTLQMFDLEDLAHAMETALSGFRSGDRIIGPGLARKILYGLYQAQRFLEKVAVGGDLSDPVLRAAAAELLRSAS